MTPDSAPLMKRVLPWLLGAGSCVAAAPGTTAATPLAPPTAATATADPFQDLAHKAGRSLVGRRAPSMTLTTLDGRRIQIGAGQPRRPVYLKFWATWCVTCREQMPAFKADYEQYARDMDIVAVNTGVDDDASAVEAYRRQVPMPMPIAIDADGRLGAALHLRVTPQHVVIDRDGIVRYIGHLEDDRLHEALRAVAAPGAASGHPPHPPQAPSRPAEAATDAPLRTVQGGEVRIAHPSSGRARLLYFLSPWCETYLQPSRPAVAQACVHTREQLTQAMQAGTSDVIGIASGLSADENAVRRYLARTGFAAPLVLDADGALFRRYGVQSFPAVIRVDDAGRPLARLGAGELDVLAHRASGARP